MNDGSRVSAGGGVGRAVLTLLEARTFDMDSGLLHVDSETTRAVRNRAGEFTLQLVKAFLQTTTYSSDHPLARAATADLYGLFKDLVEDAHEVTYLLASTVDERGVMLEGLLPDPIEVAKTFRGILGDHFVSKFHDYFVRNHIAAFTIKREIDRREFETFLQLWTEWGHRSRDGVIDVGRLSEELTQAGVLNVTVVGTDEVVGAYRHLPWPVKVALSRLRKDISRLPLLRDAPPEVIARLKAQASLDVIRPIRKMDLLRDLLLNADLVAEGLAITTDIEIEDTIVAALPPRTLQDVVGLLLDVVDAVQRRTGSLQHLHAGRDLDAFENTLRRVTRLTLTRLGGTELREVRPLLLTCHQKGLIPLEDLPEDLRRKIRAGETTDRFVAQADAYLKDFEFCGDPKNYLKYLNVLVLVLPELVHRKNTPLVSQLFDILTRHRDEAVPPFLGRNRFIEETLSQLERGGFLDGLVRLAAVTPREEREPLERAVALFGPTVVPGLLALLGTTEDVGERKACGSMLVRIGNPVVEPLVDELRSHRHSWIVARSLVAVLGELRAPEALRAVTEYANHPNPRVREESINAIARIAGTASQEQIIPFLDDKDEGVARRAVHILAGLHSVSPGFLNRVHDVVRVHDRSQEEAPEALQGTCLRALMAYEGRPLPETPDLEKALLEIVHPPRLKSLLPGRLGLRAKPDEITVLAVDVLGAIGGHRSVPVLEHLAETGADLLKTHAAESLKRVQSRM